MISLKRAARCTAVFALTASATVTPLRAWGRPHLSVTRDTVRVEWTDARGHRRDAPHGATGQLTVVDARGNRCELPLRLVTFAKWQPEPGHLRGELRSMRSAVYPLHLRLELRSTFQRGGPEVIEYDLDGPRSGVRLARTSVSPVTGASLAGR